MLNIVNKIDPETYGEKYTRVAYLGMYVLTPQNLAIITA